MKTRKQFIGIIALLAIITLANIGCSKDDEHTHDWQWVVTTPATTEADGVETETCAICGETRGTRTIARIIFTSVEGFETWLISQPDNTASKPYTVKLNASASIDFSALRTALNNAGKYVKLDLSGSTLITIPIFAFMGDIDPYGCDYLTGITIPNSVTSIEQGAFAYCTSLTSVTIPNTVTSIGQGAFTDCTSLTNVTIPNGVTSIEQQTFAGCTSLTSVTIPNSVTSIGDWAFADCTSLTSVTFATGSNITDANFGTNAFPEGSTGNGGNTLKTAYSTGKAGTYTRTDTSSSTWTKQP